jgi:hypothetical protein
MKAHFAEVLARERAALDGIVDEAMLACWRRRIVDELMTPRSAYATALQQTEDVSERADFLDRWRELIAETVHRLTRPASSPDGAPTSRGARVDVDAQKSAVLIVAALLGGRTLSLLAQDPRPLDAALELALAPFVAIDDGRTASTGNQTPTQ